MEVLKLIRQQIAEEAAALHFNRLEQEKYGKDTQTISSRRIAALKDIGNLELELKKLGNQTIDLKGEQFQKVFAYLVNIIKEVAVESLNSESADLFLTQLAAKMEGWEDQAESLIR